LGTTAAVAVAAVIWFQRGNPMAVDSRAGTLSDDADDAADAASGTDPNVVEFPRGSWKAVNLKLESVTHAPFAQTIELTGKISLNEDRVAHIFPLVDGRVDEVKIKLGDKVKKGDLLLVVQSTEVGRSMLQLFQDRLQRDFAARKNEWTKTVTANTQAMIELIRGGASIEEIEKQLTDRPMGQYRDKLMSAYVAYYKARKTLDRLTPLSKEGAIAGKSMLEAESEWNAARATLQSLLEQFQQEVRQAAAIASQSLKEIETRVAVDETNLKILGFDDASLATIDPVKQGEGVSHYPIRSPFDGTIISKDVVLLERVGPNSQILSIADLSTVWVTTDIYEEHLPLLKQLENRTIEVHSPAWPGKTFKATIFYTGDVVHESSRTISMRAFADNADGLLKPGMFVNVVVPSVAGDHVIQVPLAAIQEHEGKSFVFVHTKGDQFERRDVTLGLQNSKMAEVVEGLSTTDVVVTSGGFTLKSQMLSELLEE
jgi:cobalt-zinc-cadmium efflux system membrane fusion protein